MAMRGHQASKWRVSLSSHSTPSIPALRRRRERVLRQMALSRYCMEFIPDRTHRHRAERVAMISVASVRKHDAIRPRLPILQRHLHGHFHRHRTGVGQKTTPAVQALSRPAYGTDSPQVDHGLCRGRHATWRPICAFIAAFNCGWL